MNKKKKELGKGLRALLSNIENTSNTTEKVELVKELSSNYAQIRLDLIEVNPYQPRVEFDEEELMDLAKSIKVHGLIQPLTVRNMGDQKYQLISGERRMRASKMAGLTEVPAYIRLANDQEMLELALIENIQRADLNALEVAISYQRLMDECDLTHELLSDRIGKNRSTITNYVRLLKLPPEIQNAIKNGSLTMGHARSLAGISNIVLQMDTFHKCIDAGWSVRALETYLRSLSTKPSNKTSKPQTGDDIMLDNITKALSEKFGTKVQIKRDVKGKGQFILKFKNDQEFNTLFDLLKES